MIYRRRRARFRAEIRSFVAAVGVVATSAAGCSRAPRRIQATTVVDSAGVHIVTNPQPSMGEDTRWANIAKRPALEIGAREGQPPEEFSYISTVAESPRGNIVIVDPRAHEVRVFDRLGRHLRTIGRTGGGPGEFQGHPWVRFVQPDTVVAWDPEIRRVSWFTSEGELVRDRSYVGTPFDRVSKAAYIDYRWDVLADGTVIALVGHPTARVDGLQKEPLSLMVVSGDSGTVRWLSNLPGYPRVNVGHQGADAILYPSISGGNWQVLSNPARIVVADDATGRWALSIYDLKGKVVTSIRASIQRRPVTRTVAGAAQQWWLDLADRLPPGSRREFEAAVKALPVPDSLPAISTILVDVNKRLWVKRWAGMWEQDGNDVYDIVDVTGRWLGWVEMPRAYGRIVTITDHDVFFVQTDSLDVPVMRKHRLLRREPIAAASTRVPGVSQDP